MSFATGKTIKLIKSRFPSNSKNAVEEFGGTEQPAWAGLCEGDITRNFYGPHDMNSIRESISGGLLVR